MLGLPGDWTSISRFVRLTEEVKNAKKPKKTLKTVNLLFHMLNTVDRPKGITAVKVEGINFQEITALVHRQGFDGESFTIGPIMT